MYDRSRMCYPFSALGRKLAGARVDCLAFARGKQTRVFRALRQIFTRSRQQTSRSVANWREQRKKERKRERAIALYLSAGD